MKPNYIPNEDRVVVKEPKALKNSETITESGIIQMGKEEDEKLIEVEVVAVGDGVLSNGTVAKMYLVPGQKISIGKRSGTPYDMDGESYRIIRQADVQFLIGEE